MTVEAGPILGHALAHAVLVLAGGLAAGACAAVLVLCRRLRGARAELAETRRKLDLARRRARELAVLADSAKALRNEFLSNISHEVRTPMNTILGMTDLALATDLTAKQRRWLQRVREAGDALLGLLSDVLDLAKIHARRLELYPSRFLLRDCVGDVVRRFRTQAERKGLVLDCTVDPDVPDGVWGDPGRLRQVIGALLSNAVKFTPRGEVRVRVVVESRTDEEVTLGVSVSDTGIGIAPDRRQAVFEAFKQGDGSETRQYGGCGIGLAIAAQLVSLMDGRIAVDGREGEGSTFRFTVRLGLAAHAPVRLSEEAWRLQGLRVLIVSADPEMQLALEQLAAEVEMVPLSVDSGAAGREALSEAQGAGRPFPLVVLGPTVGQPDGFALAAQFRAAAGPRGAKVVLVTSAGSRGDAARAAAAGASAYLTLPMGWAEFAEAVTLALADQPDADGRPRLITQHTLRESRGCRRAAPAPARS